MSKTVRKFPIDDLWNIGKSESWYSDMATRGLHLKNIGRMFVYFEKGEPSKTKYRFDVLYEKPSHEQLNIYKDSGWDFVTHTGLFYIFSSPENSNAPELHTDPIEQSFTLDKLNKILKKNVIIISVAVLLMIGMIFGLYFFQDEPYLYIAEGAFIQQPFLIIVELHVLYSAVRNYIYVRRIKTTLIDGVPINHKDNWKKGRLLNGIVNTLIMIISIITIIIPIMQIVKDDEYTLPETKNELPIIRLSDIELNPDLQREVKYNDEGVDRRNNVKYEWSPLAPVKYDVYEHSIVKDEMWYDNSGEYSPSIYTRFYQLTFENMADEVLKDLIHRNIYDPRVKIERIDNPDFDHLYVALEDYSTNVFASWDNNVIYIRYHGKKDIDHIIALLLEIVTE